MPNTYSHCKENHHGQRPSTWKQGSKETQETEAGCCSGEFDYSPIQSSQVDQAPKLIVGVTLENATSMVAFLRSGHGLMASGNLVAECVKLEVGRKLTCVAPTPNKQV